MRENFELALSFVFRWEGEISDDPDDPGGLTKWGIDVRSHPQVKDPEFTKLDAAKIYKTEYWDRAQCDIVPFPKDILLFDAAVNCGVSKSIQFMADSSSWEEQLFRRVKHYVDICVKNPKLVKFFFGWEARVMDLKTLVKDEIKKRT